MNYVHQYEANTPILTKTSNFRSWVFGLIGEYFYYWHWGVLPKVNDAKTFKDLVVWLVFCAYKSHVYCRLVHITGAFKSLVNLVLPIIGSD